MQAQIEGFRVSSQQRRLWLLQAEASAFRAQCAILIEGHLKTGALEDALSQVVNRHEILRTTFRRPPEVKVPVQVVDDEPAISLDAVESATLGEDAARRIDEWMEAERARPFDFEQGPLLRLSLLTLSPEKRVLLLDLPSMCADGLSLNNLVAEISRGYGASVEGGEPGDEPVQYAQFAEWQNELLSGPEAEAARQYWREQKRLALQALKLPFEGKATATRSFAPRWLPIAIEPSTASRMQAAARRYDTPTDLFLLACWQTLLWKKTTQPDVVVHKVFDGRKYDDLREAVGLFAKCIPIHCHFDKNLTFSEALEQIKRSAQGAYEWQHYFAGEPVDAAREASTNGPVIFEMERWPSKSVAAGAAFSICRQYACFEAFKLKLCLAEKEDSLSAELYYDPEVFSAGDVRRLADEFSTLLAGVVEDPDARVADFNILTQAEQHRLLVEFNNTATPASEHRCLHQLLDEQAERTPDEIAVVYKDRQLTYAALNAHANPLAHYLQSLGVGPEVLVGIYMERSLEMMVGILAVLKAGGAYLPLDTSHPKQRVAFMLENAKCSIVLTHKRMEADLPVDSIRVVHLDSQMQAPAGDNKQAPASQAQPENLAYVIYTSGSTGSPKGVMISHRGLVNYLSWCTQAYAVADGNGSLVHSPIGFDLTITALFAPLLCGKAVELLDEAAGVEGLSQALQRQRDYSLVKLTPAHLEVLSGLLGEEAGGRARALIIGGEALVGERLTYWQQQAPETRLINEYGPTETVVGCCVYEVGSAEEVAGAVPIGKPIGNTQMYVLDERGRAVAVGVAGEIYIGGDGLARGYLGDAGLTAARFVPNPYSAAAGARMYKTGDQGRHLGDGNLEYLGRLDKQVKVRGYRIELGEIEATIRQHAAVSDTVVTVDESAAGDKRLVAYLVARQKDALSVSDLRRHLREQLPDYMTPAAYVLMDALPLTPNGKVDQHKLPAPDSVRPEQETAYAAPATELERRIADIWQQMLQIEKVGVNDNFFDLGGHSLLMAQVHGKLLKLVGNKISMLDLFMHPTVSSLAKYLSEKRGEGSPQPGLKQRNRANRSNPRAGSDIAIVAMTCRFPGARDTDEFWRNLRDGVESISFMSDEELKAAGIMASALSNPNYVKARGKLKDIELFDASFFGFTPREAALLDPQQRLFLECAWEALELAGYDSESYDGRVGVYAGVGINHYLINNLFSNPELLASMGAFQTILSSDKDFMPTRVSYKLNLKGPSINVQTACSTSLVAVCLAAQSLLNDECDMAMAGGVTVAIPQDTGYLYQEGGIASPDGHCRAFDAKAQGTVGGNGAGIVVLKRLQDALSDGDTIHALIKGFAVNNDGADKIGFTAPSIHGQAAVIAEALDMAGVAADSITYIETHGTGTQLGDPIEAAGLMLAFQGRTTRQQYCGLGAVKSNIGHLDTAAGVAGLIKTVLSLKHGQMPATLHYEASNEKIAFAGSPFYVNERLREWEVESGVRRAGVSSFGIGGTNAHVIVEEWVEKEEAAAGEEGSEKWELLVVSAKTKAGLEEASRRLSEELKNGERKRLKDVAYTLAAGRRAFNHRRVILCQDVKGAVAALQAGDPARVFTSLHESGERPVVFMFPGQGSQYPNMARGLYETQPTFREDIDRCFELLEPLLGHDLRQTLYPAADRPGEAEKQLTQTLLTQPSLFVIEYALAALLMRWGIRPQAMIGHSIGEYVAACLAGVFSLEEGLRLVAERAKLMQQLPAGAMLAISREEKEVLPLLNQGLSLAAVNGASLCVVSGPAPALDELQSQLVGQGVAYRRQHTSHAFHSEMMEPILDQFTEQVSQIKLNEPQIPYVSNLTGTWMTAADATDPTYWSRHLRHTVRFSDGLRELLEDRDRILLEVGPGHTLSTLSRQHPAKAASVMVLSSLRHPHEEQPDAAFFLKTVARLWLAGTKLDWPQVYAHRACRRIPLPTYPFERQRHWIEPQKHRNGLRNRQRSLARKLDLAEWFYIPVWKQSRPMKLIEPSEQPRKAANWLLFADATSLAGEIAERLKQRGDRVATVAPGERFRSVGEDAYEINPARRDDYESLLKALRAGAGSPDEIVHLWSVDEDAGHESAPAAFTRVLDRGFYSLLLLVQALEGVGFIDRLRIAVVSNNMQKVTGEETLRPEQATLLGICKVIPQEYPNLSVRSIDVGAPAAAGWQRQRQLDLLAMELATAPADSVVAYRGQQRWLQVFEATEMGTVAEAAMPLREAGVYLITGGLGNIGLTMADYLARAARARLVLTTRSNFPEKPQWDAWLATHNEQDVVSRKIRKLQTLEATGAEVWAVSADAASPQQMEELIAAIGKRFGQLNGVIHAAGVPADQTARSIQETSRQDCERHFEAKSRALFVLETSLAATPLDFCILLSSLAAVLGGLGFAAYASANAFMDAFVHRHNQTHPDRWVSINWDGWDFRDQPATSTPAHQATLAMTSAEGIEAFRRILADQTTSQVAVSTTDLQLRIDQWIKLESLVDRPPAEVAETDSLHPRPELQSAYAAPTSEIEQTLAGIWQELLGIAPVGIHDNFFELGGDSILSIQVISKSNRAGLQFTTRQLFQHPTISELARVASQAQARPDEESASATIRLTAEQQRRADELARADRQIQDIYPLSPMQQGMLFHSLYDPESRPYIKEVGCTFRGPLNMEAFEQAWQTVIERHVMLRTSFEWEGLDQPLQVVRREVKLPVEKHDLSGLDEPEREKRLAGLVEVERGRGVDLSQAPVMRLTLIRLGEELHRFIWSFHHLLGDGWSGPIILREVFGCYASFSKGEHPGLGPVRPYRDYIAWLQERDIVKAEAFWREELKGFTAPTPIRLHRGSLSTAALTNGYARQEKRLPQEVAAALQSLARQHQMTLNTVIQGAWAMLLGHDSGNADVLFGVTSSGRPAVLEGIEQMVGLFINTLPLRIRLQPDALLLPWLKQLQARQAELRQYEYSPLAQVKRWSEIPRSQPLFDSILIFDNFPVDSTVHTQSPGISIIDVTSSVLQNDYSLTLTVLPHADLLLSALYDRSRFDDDSINRLLESFQALLRSIAESPDVRLSDIEARLTEADLKQRGQRKRERFESRLKGFTQARPRGIRLSEEVLVETDYLQPGGLLPLVIRPRLPEVDLQDWARSEQEFIRKSLDRHGALLLRGFAVNSIAAFAAFARANSEQLLDYREGSTPRTDLGNQIYTSTEYPADQSIPLHNEMSYSRNWPATLWFYCAQAARKGGETPIADSRKVFQLIDPKIRERFMRKQVLYVRNYGEGLDLSWQRAFQTADCSEVEQYCRKAHIEFEWRDGDRLRTRQVCQAVVNHRVTGEAAWFNQAHLFHWSNLEASVAESLLSLMSEEELPRNAYYGDGSRLETSILSEIRAIYREAAVAFPWQRGDILMVDNVLAAHGRMPFEGDRKIVVAMADLITSDVL